MAKQPQWRVNIDPAGGGPMAVVPSNVGAQGRALAGLGAAMQQRGEFLTAEAKDAEQRTRRLQQATEVSRFAMEALGDYNKLKDELATVQDPEERYPRFEQAQNLIRTRLDAIGDPQVRSQAETWLNEESAIWDADVRTGTQSLRIKQADAHLASLGEDAIRRRDISQIQMYADELAGAGFISDQQKADLTNHYEATIQAELAKDEITAATLLRPTYDEQVRFLKAMKRPPELTEQEWAGFRDGLHAKLDLDRAAAAQRERLAALAVDMNDRKILADAWTPGKLDLAEAVKMMEEGQASPGVVDQARRIAIDGAARVDKPETYMEAERWLSRVRAKPQRREAALKWLSENAASLTESTWKGYVTSYERAGDPADPMGTPTAKMLDGLIEARYFWDDKAQTMRFGEYTGDEAEAAYIRAKQTWRKWVTDHPEATDEEMNTRYTQFFAPIEKASRLQQILRWFHSAGAPRGVTWEGQNRYRLAPIDVEPETKEEFTEQFMALPYGSAEQDAYYEKWAKKWR